MQQFPLEELDELYQEVILDHYRSSRNKDKLEGPDIEFDGFNPFCGDQIILQVKLADDRVEAASFSGQGCSISQASASMMTELLKGKTLEEAQALTDIFRKMMQGSPPTEEELVEMGALEALQGVRKFPIRIKCALLAWATLEDGIEQYNNRDKSAEARHA